MPSAHYVGKAGQLVVMSEFLLRGYNVAMPEVDTGDDIFVVQDLLGDLWRIQVKTAYGRTRASARAGTFSVGMEQLRLPRRPDLIYVFALWLAQGQWDFVVIARQELHDAIQSGEIGRRVKDRAFDDVRHASLRKRA